METVTDEDVSKLSKIGKRLYKELRKLKLAEYLAAKGRLKAPNPKPYLKEKPVTKEHAENNQKSKITGDGKENRGINGTNIKEVKKVKTLTEVDKNTSSKKGLSISSLDKVKTRSFSNSRNTCQTQNNRTAFLQNPRKRHDAENTAMSFSAAKRTDSQSLQNVQPKACQGQPVSHAANKTQMPGKSSLVSVCGPSESRRGNSGHRRTDQSCTKKDIHKKLTDTSIKTTSAGSLKSRRPMNTAETRIQTNSVSKTQVKPGQQSRSQSAAPKIGMQNYSSQSNKPINQKSNSATDRSGVNQRKDIPCIVSKVDPTKAKSNSSVTNRVTRSASSTLSQPANREGSAVIKNKQPATVKPTNATASTKLLGRSTKSCILPQTECVPQTASRELHQPTKRSSQAKPLQVKQMQTPKSSFCPSTQGVRTAPVDGMKKPTAAQEERL
ncbi:Cytoskeleton-associated protein 2-like [Labeo rohita]|uniref:Cytoskeleton-associated protein 2-like n=1 Tax=Labeo rohita TaxID=84645 RepID=A0ABQ8MQ31_LABRO|nr:Cytoskeleton-associated protein 2-like [Labeo rohita]